MMHKYFLIKTCHKCRESLQIEGFKSSEAFCLLGTQVCPLHELLGAYAKICLFITFFSWPVMFLGVSANGQRKNSVLPSSLHNLSFVSVKTKDS